jgi:FixJ family two-component response regulator
MTDSQQRASKLVAETSAWIAIVDDDPAVLRALSRLLRSRAFRVDAYGSGQDYLAALPDALPHCLIVDFQMPEMNGLELQQHLINSGIAVPTILITAHGDATIHSQPANDTFVARLRKPLHDEALFSAIHRAIGSPGDVG